MAKNKRNQKVKEQEKENPSLNPNQSGQEGQTFPLGIAAAPPVPAAGTLAPSVPSGEGDERVQAGQVAPEQLEKQYQRATQEEVELAKQAVDPRAIHPELGMTFESNIIRYKGRKTEFLTLPMRLTTQAGYPFQGKSRKEKVRITLAPDGSKLTVERL